MTKKIEGRVMASARACAGSVYTVEVDRVDQEQWNRIVPKFDDANLMQTWSYGADRWGENNLSHVLLSENGKLVSAAQVVIKTVPLFGAGICRVRGGPLWKLRGRNKDPEILRQMLRALRDAFVNRRGLLLQIFPTTLEDGTKTIPRIFEEEGFALNPDNGDPQTALIDLSYSLDDIRKSFKKKRRYNLVFAERSGLTTKHGTSDELFEAVGKLYREGLRRRRLVAVLNVDQLRQTQRSLPEDQKLRVMLCEYQGEPVAGIAVSFLGDTAQVFLSGTGDRGLKFSGSYLLHWRMLEWLKERGCRWYDLDGLDPAVPSGDTRFKLGFAGRLGLLPERLGPFESSDDSTRQVFVRAGLRLRRNYTGLRATLSSGVLALRSKLLPANPLPFS